MAEAVEIPRRVPAAHVFNMSSSGKTPFLSVDEVTRLGYNLMLLPNFAALAAIKAISEVFAEIKRAGTVAGILNRCASLEQFMALGGLQEFQEIERRFGSEGHESKSR
jgi:2-methylisocitrate lyase-like PEP mutase family enzyme